MDTVLPTVELKVQLLKDRSKLGTATLYDRGKILAGPFDCLGRADTGAAAAHGNPEMNPLWPMGNTPTGIYTAQVVNASTNIRSFGPYKRILLIPYSGQCAICEETRSGLMCHGGELNQTYKWWNGLRPTHGCIRFSDTAMKSILDAIPELNTHNLLVTVTEIVG